jgi:hypothetical protein
MPIHAGATRQSLTRRHLRQSSLPEKAIFMPGRVAPTPDIETFTFSEMHPSDIAPAGYWVGNTQYEIHSIKKAPQETRSFFAVVLLAMTLRKAGYLIVMV